MEKTLVQLPLFQEDSLVNPSPLREREREQTMIATSGMRCYELFRVVNPPGLLAKMLKGLLTSKTAWYSDRCKMIWKERASKSNVLLFQLVASVRGINETESGLLATPNTMDHLPPRSKEGTLKLQQGHRKGRTRPSNLREQVDPQTMAMYPTPTAGNCMDVFQPPEYVEQNTTGWTVTRKGTGTKFGAKLNDVVHKIQNEKMYPTPRARDWKDSVTKVPPSIQKGKFGKTLGSMIAQKEMLPTPTASEHKARMQGNTQASKCITAIAQKDREKPGGKLNPNFVEFLMGYPMNYTQIEPTESKHSETQSCHKSQNKSSGVS